MVIENDTIVSPKIINEIFKPQIIYPIGCCFTMNSHLMDLVGF
jgi:hypothetical protein